MSVSALTWLTTVRTLPAATPVRYCTSRLPSKQLLPPVLLVLISTEAGVRGCVSVCDGGGGVGEGAVGCAYG